MPPRSPRSPRALRPEDKALWAAATRDVTPLAGRSLPEDLPSVAVPAAAPAGDTAIAPPAPSPAQPRLAPLAPLERRLRQRLARGTREVDRVLDLHGMRQEEAHRALLAFLHRSHAAGDRILLVITGKGSGAGGERGVLRRLVPFWLAEPGLRRLVVGFEWAARSHGGEGALYLRLRRG